MIKTAIDHLFDIKDCDTIPNDSFAMNAIQQAKMVYDAEQKKKQYDQIQYYNKLLETAYLEKINWPVSVDKAYTLFTKKKSI